MDRLTRRYTFLGAAILATLLLGTAGFVLIEDYPPFDAFYMTLTTMTTVGYGEIHPLSRAGRMFNTLVILIGVTVMFLAIGAMTQTVIELEFGEYFGKRRTRRMIEKLRDHYIVCGFGRVGRSTAQELQRSGVPFVVMDRSDDRVERAMRAGMLAVVGDATRDEALREVGLERARGLVAALASDADNLFLILSARRRGRSIRALLHHRPAAGASDDPPARASISRFRHRASGSECRHRASACRPYV